MKNYVIYSLQDHKTGEICYVGRTNNISKRMSQHKRNGLPSKQSIEVSAWSCRMCDNGINWNILESDLTLEESKKQEKQWIKKLWNEGQPLLNMTENPGLFGLKFQHRIHSSKWWRDGGY
jgi:hypothetical protein